MDTLHSVLMTAAAVLLVLALCSGIKAVCRKILSKISEKKVGLEGEKNDGTF